MAVESSRRSAFSVYQQLQQGEENYNEKEDSIKAERDGEESTKAEREVEESSNAEREVKESSKAERDMEDNSGQKSTDAKLKSRKRKMAQKMALRKRRKIAAEEGLNGKKRRKSKTEKKKKSKKLFTSYADNESEEQSTPTGENGAEQEDSSIICSANEVSPRIRKVSSANLDVPFLEQFNPESYKDSREATRELFKLLISPVDIDQFYTEVWEQRPMVLRRHKPHYNDGLLSTDALDTIFRENHLEFTTNVDITSYEEGKRHTHNPDGRAFASVVWEFFKNGCSVRVLNPQSYCQPLWLLNSTLQEHFKSCVGANVYLTPAGSQGFAPHYDDIDAFVLQLEGRKHWKVYSPRSIDEALPRYSSPNFTEDELGQQLLDVVLEPGDLLYFPRGFTHQAATPPDTHSLHITVSANQKNTWGDFLEKLVPAALQRAIAENIEFREGLPNEYLDYTGIVNSDTNDVRRTEFLAKISSLISQLVTYAPIDAASDQMGASYVHDCLPPCLTSREEQLSVNNGGAKWKDGKIVESVTLTLDSKVRLLRHGVIRLVMGEDRMALHFSTQNSRVYHEKELMGIDISENDAPAIDHLIKSYPEFVTVDSLPTEEDSTPDDKVSLCYALYDQGLLLINP